MCQQKASAILFPIRFPVIRRCNGSASNLVPEAFPLKVLGPKFRAGSRLAGSSLEERNRGVKTETSPHCGSVLMNWSAWAMAAFITSGAGDLGLDVMRSRP